MDFASQDQSQGWDGGGGSGVLSGQSYSLGPLQSSRLKF